MARTPELKIQKWGNSLALRIPSAIARQAGFHLGQPVRLSMQDTSLLVSSAGKCELTLAQKLALFDSHLHGGEVMVSRPMGVEVL